VVWDAGESAHMPATGVADAPATGATVKSGTPPTPQNPPETARRAAPRPVVLVAAGDIACNPANEKFKDLEGDETGCRQKATSDLVLSRHPDAVMPLGDSQYQRGTYNGFQLSYGLTWGRFLGITHPVVGNHEYLTPGATGYFRYFGTLAGDPTQGYYSYELGSWHVVVLNSQCEFVGGCGAGSAQEKWLRSDLASHKSQCTLAAWHEPRWSSGEHHSNPALDAFWRDLHFAGAEVVLSGHDHDYERFQALDADGRADAAQGMRQFVVGTGGVGLRPFDVIAAGSEIRRNGAFGVLSLTLRTNSYSWRFDSLNSSLSDSGSGACH